MRLTVFSLILLLPVTAWGATPPKPLDALFAQLRTAGSPEEAKPIEGQIEALFLQSGSPSVDLLMTRAAAAGSAGDKDTAKALYAAVSAIAPSFAEGWYRRALLQGEMGDDSGALVSLQKAVSLNPRQFAALEQLGEMLEDYGDKPGALKLYRQVEALDPQYEGLEHHIDGLTRDVEGQGI